MDKKTIKKRVRSQNRVEDKQIRSNSNFYGSKNKTAQEKKHEILWII